MKPILPVAILGIWIAAFSGCGGGGGTAEEPYPSQSWVLVDDHVEPPGIHTQGLASVPDLGPGEMVFTSRYTIDRWRDGALAVLKFAIPRALAAMGYDHMGDPDAHGKLVYGPLEDNADPKVNPYHRAYVVFDAESLDPIGWANDPGAPDEPYKGDAPWAAVSPDGRWLVTGEWAPMRRLTIYSTAELTSGGDIQAAQVVEVDAPRSDVQGCDFDGPRVLVCADDDADAGRAISAVFLSAPIQGEQLPQGLTGRTEVLFPAPVPKAFCENSEEVEGVDVERDTLRVLVIGSCVVDTYLYRYER